MTGTVVPEHSLEVVTGQSVVVTYVVVVTTGGVWLVVHGVVGSGVQVSHSVVVQLSPSSVQPSPRCQLPRREAAAVAVKAARMNPVFMMRVVSEKRA